LRERAPEKRKTYIEGEGRNSMRKEEKRLRLAARKKDR